MKVNENLAKVSAGYIVLQEPLEIDNSVKFIVEGSVVKVEDHSNQDGTIKRVFVIKGIIGEVMKDEISMTQKDTVKMP